MAVLCFVVDNVSYNTTVVIDATQCSGYVAIPASQYWTGITYEEANQIIVSVASLFALVFIFRVARKKLGF